MKRRLTAVALASLLATALPPGCGPSAGGVDLWEAVEAGDAGAVGRFAAAGGDVSVKNVSGTDTPLPAAFEARDPSLFDTLLRAGADPNAVTNDRRSVPHRAAHEVDGV